MSASKETREKFSRIPLVSNLFYKIAEPRIIRIMQLAVYIFCLWAGVLVVENKPEQFLRIIGEGLAFLFGISIIVGSVLSAISVLPGIWWLERVGIIVLFTCVLVYIVILAYLQATPVALAFVLGFAICLVERWIDIRGAQLAPREA